MLDFFSEHEAMIRALSFVGVLGLVGLWEQLAPRRRLSESKARRWANNLGLVLLNNVLIRILYPGAAVGVAFVAQQHGWGLFNVLEVPIWIEVTLSLLLLDLVIYGQHVAMHYVPILWRLHRVHHADLDFDATTGIRFHPIEIFVSLLIKAAAIVLIGPPAVAVVIFAVLLNATSMFNHGNIRIAGTVDKKLRWLLVTPDMHRVHHSVEIDETNSNFGFNLPWWDRLFKTYRDQPRLGHEAMTIGIPAFRDGRMCTTLLGMLKIPFIGKTNEQVPIS